METLYERLGGDLAIIAAVNLFYERVLADERLRRFFVDLDMEKQKTKQVSFMMRVFGGPSDYHGRELRESHQEMVKNEGLTDIHFDAVAEHLRDTLIDMGVDPETVADVLALVETTRTEVLDR